MRERRLKAILMYGRRKRIKAAVMDNLGAMIGVERSDRMGNERNGEFVYR